MPKRVSKNTALNFELDEAVRKGDFVSADKALARGAKFHGGELHHAAILGDEAGVEYLLDRAAPVHVSMARGGFTPLHEAIIEGRSKCALMLAAGRPREALACDINGATPLMFAAWTGQLDVVAALLPLSNVHAVDKEGLGPLDREENGEAKELVRAYMHSREEKAALADVLHGAQVPARSSGKPRI